MKVLYFTVTIPTVLASAPDFSKNPMKKLIQVQIGSTVDFECKPKASPKAKCSWKKGGEQLHENERYHVTLVYLF